MTMIQIVTNDDEHDLALAEIARLWNATTTRDVAALEALTILVEGYEAKRWPSTVALDPIDLLVHAMSPDVGQSKAEFIEIIGSAAGASQILARKRPLTLDMIRKLSERWGIAVQLLTPRYALATEAALVSTGRPKRSRPRSSAPATKAKVATNSSTGMKAKPAVGPAPNPRRPRTSVKGAADRA